MKKNKKILVINFKTYKQGREVLNLIKEINNFFNNKKFIGGFNEIILGIQATDLYEANELLKKLNKNKRLKIFVQHIDYFKRGRETGFILPEAVKEDGADGTFLNHSEHLIKLRVIKKTIKRCNENKLKTMVFVSNLKQANKIKKFKIKPDYIVFEPPELVAGKKSISEKNPELIKEFSEKFKLDFIVGAGIKSRRDVKTAFSLGARGIAVSSAITRSDNVKKVLKELSSLDF